MGPDKFRPELSAILSSEVKGYSRLKGQGEEGTLRTLGDYKELIGGLLQRYRGGAVGPAGDRV